MSGFHTRQQQIKRFMYDLPGKRNIDIPEHFYDPVFTIARGITQPLYGRDPTPHQMQWFWDNGLDTPEQIHQAFSALPHPHAEGLSVGEFGQWTDAYQRWVEATQKPR